MNRRYIIPLYASRVDGKFAKKSVNRMTSSKIV